VVESFLHCNFLQLVIVLLSKNSARPDSNVYFI
jgi:hypothetical protein